MMVWSGLVCVLFVYCVMCLAISCWSGKCTVYMLHIFMWRCVCCFGNEICGEKWLREKERENAWNFHLTTNTTTINNHDDHHHRTALPTSSSPNQPPFLFAKATTHPISLKNNHNQVYSFFGWCKKLKLTYLSFQSINIFFAVVWLDGMLVVVTTWFHYHYQRGLLLLSNITQRINVILLSAFCL